MQKTSNRPTSSSGFLYRRFQILGVLTLVLLVTGGCARRQVEMARKDQIMKAIDLYERGRYQEQNENLEQAEKLYRQSVAISPRPVVHYRLGVVLSRQGEYQEALDNLDQALLLAPNLTQAERERVRVHALIRLSEQQQPQEPDVGQPDLTGIIPDIETQELPEEEPAIRPMVRTDAEIEKAEESIEEAEASAVAQVEPVATIEPEPTAVPTDIPPIPDPTPESLPTMTPVPSPTELPELAKEPPPARPSEGKELQEKLDLAYEATDRGDYDTAIDLFQDALILSPGDPKIHYNLGFLFQQQEQFVKSYLRYRRALEIDPNFGQAWNNLGFVMERLARSEGALDCYHAAIASGNREAYFNAGLLLEKKGRLEEALDLFREYLQKGGDPELRKKAEEHIMRLQRRF